jgi:hypothetical protein
MNSDGRQEVLGAAYGAGDIIWWNVARFEPQGTIVSSILDTDTIPDWEGIDWTADEPPGTSVYFQVRASLDPQSMGEWSDDIVIPGDLIPWLADGDRFVQYRAFLTATDQVATPILDEVTVGWTGMSAYPPSPIVDLTIQYDGVDVQLSWTPVVEDTNGNPVVVSHYTVYMSLHDPYFVPTAADSIGVVFPPDSAFVDTNALTDNVGFYNVRAVTGELTYSGE